MPYRRILVAVDLTPIAAEVLARAADIAEAYGAELVVAHFCETYPAIELDYGMVGIPGIGTATAGVVEAAEQRLAALLDSCGLSDAQRVLRLGTARLDIPALAEETGADLVVVGAANHRGLERLLGSTARAVLGDTGCDVLSVRLRNRTDTD